MRRSTISLGSLYTIVFSLFLMVSCDFSAVGEAEIPVKERGTDEEGSSELPNENDGELPNGVELKSRLHDLMQSKHRTYLDYTPDVWEALKQTDLDPDNPNEVFLIYGWDHEDSDEINDLSRNKNRNGGGSGEWNREHVYPKSLGNPNLGTEGPGADAHMIRASDVKLNNKRGNLPFIDGEGTAHRMSNAWYPGDQWKGDVARIIMYMEVHYGDRTESNEVGVGGNNYSADIPDIFLEWNAEDPVSQYERNRNDILEEIQGNRNPFIDNPSLATKIWGGPQAEDTGVNPFKAYSN